MSGLIRSPAHPNLYPHGLSCRWIISARPGYAVRLSWLSFSLEASRNCQYDSVSVWDNSTIPGTGGLMGSYCGSVLPPDLTSSDNLVTIIFNTDHSIAGEGFTASYMLLDTRSQCGGTYTTDTGVLRSPGYPQPYPHSRTCEWVVRVQPGRQIRLNVTEFDLESHSNCNYDYLEIRNGGYSTSPLIGKFCGSEIPPIIPSFSNQLYLKFQSDRSRYGAGFKIFWDGTSTGD